MTSTNPAVPDRFRLLLAGEVSDGDMVLDRPVYGCSVNGGDLQPGSGPYLHWNSIVRDIDLTRYPGQKGGEQFIWRSKPLRNGSALMFEVRGYIEVLRQ